MMKKSNFTRRFILKYFSITAVFGTTVNITLFNKKNVTAGDKKHVRLPGSIKESEFIYKCIKCGQCVQVCPYQAVKLLDIDDGFLVGTPVIIPRERGCYLCDLLPCVLSCPSGALDHKISLAEEVDMGKAVINNISKCYGITGEVVKQGDVDRITAFGARSDFEKELLDKLNQSIGKKCEICIEHCPYPKVNDAIVLMDDDIMENDKYFPEVKDKCVGCGVCVELCPANIFTIKTDRS